MAAAWLGATAVVAVMSPRQHRPRLQCAETNFANAYVNATNNDVKSLFSLERFPDH